MARAIKNKHFYNQDQAVLVTLREEFIMLGFETELEPGHLTVLSRRKKKVKREKRDKK